MNPKASPVDCDMTIMAVANVLCFGGNQTDTGKMTIKDGINGLPYYFTNGLIHGATTALLEDGVREDAARWARGRTETVEVPRNLFAVTVYTSTAWTDFTVFTRA